MPGQTVRSESLGADPAPFGSLRIGELLCGFFGFHPPNSDTLVDAEQAQVSLFFGCEMGRGRFN